MKLQLLSALQWVTAFKFLLLHSVTHALLPTRKLCLRDLSVSFLLEFIALKAKSGQRLAFFSSSACSVSIRFVSAIKAGFRFVIQSIAPPILSRRFIIS